MASFMLDRGIAASAGGLLNASPSPPQSQLQSSASSSPLSSFSSLAAPSASQLAQLGLPSGTVALPGPNGGIIWAAPQQQAAAASAGLPYQLLSAGMVPQGLQPSSSTSAPSLPSFALSGLSALSLPSLSQLLAVSQQQTAQQQQQTSAQSLLSSPQFPAALPLSSLNLNSLLFSPYQPVLPLSAAGSGLTAAPLQIPPQPQPVQSSSALAPPPFSAPSGGGSSELGASTNAALLQLQATLLQVAQTGNQQAVQQLQGLNALMQQCGQSQPQLSATSAQSPPPAAPLLPLPPFVSGGVGANCADGGYLSGGSRNSCSSPLSGGPLQQHDSPAAYHRLLQFASQSAFKPRMKRERDGGYGTTSGSGGNSSSGNSSGGSVPTSSRNLSGGRHVSSKQALKSSHLRHDVREAVAANHARMEMESAAAAVVAANTGKDGALSGDSGGASSGDGNGSSSSGNGSGSGSDEDRRNQADDEDDSERESKRRRKKHNAAAHGGAGSGGSNKHPFHLFASLDALHRSLLPSNSSDASSASSTLPSAPDAAQLKAAANDPLVFLYLPNQKQQQSGLPQQPSMVSTADSAAASGLKLPTGGAGAGVNYLNNPSQQVQPLFPAVEPLSSQQQQQQAQSPPQPSASSPSPALPAGGAGHLPLQVVSQQVAGQYAHQRGSGSGSDSGSGGSSSEAVNNSSSSSSSEPPGHGAAAEQQQQQQSQQALPQQSDTLPAVSTSSAPAGGKKMRKKHIVTDRQRRAKIKEGMEQLRSLLSSHGSFTSDQVSIMTASVQLIQKLRQELTTLRSHTSQLKDELHSYRQLHTEADPTAAAAAAVAAGAMPPLSLLDVNMDAAGSGQQQPASAEEISPLRMARTATAELSPLRSASSFGSPSLTAPMAAMSVSSSPFPAGDDGSRSGSDSGDSQSPSPADEDESPVPSEDSGESGSSSSEGQRDGNSAGASSYDSNMDCSKDVSAASAPSASQAQDAAETLTAAPQQQLHNPTTL